jgi:hypothetical protein
MIHKNKTIAKGVKEYPYTQILRISDMSTLKINLIKKNIIRGTMKPIP